MGVVRFAIRVRPGASRTKVGGTYGDDAVLVVAVNAPPVDGAANEAVVKAVAAALGLRPSRIDVVTGHTARTKVLAAEVPDGGEAALEADLDALRSA
jgi:uncharacterized protein YggU (UPF0235/DUF167 family)